MVEVKFALESYGLTEKEIAVYTELLQLGSVPINEIAKRLGYPRSTVYHLLEYLINKGLAASIIKSGVTYYNATEPEQLQEELKEKLNLIDSVLPQLKSLKSHIKSPSQVELYEGFQGVHTILSDLCRVKQEVYYFGGYKKSLNVLKHLPNYVRVNRIDRKIPAKIIYDPVDEPILHTKEYQQVTELRFLDSMENFPCMIFIYGDKVSMFSFKNDLVGMIITNKDFAEAMKFIFSLFWDQAKPSNLKQNIKLKDVIKRDKGID